MWLALLVAACLLVVGAVRTPSRIRLSESPHSLPLHLYARQSLNVTDGAGLLRAALSRDKQ